MTMAQIEKTKLHINFATKDAPWGGGNSFLRNLKGELSKKGNYINDKTQADVIIFNAHHHLLETLKLKRKFPDKISNLILSVIQAVPDFFLGLLLIYFLFFKLQLVPAPVGRLGLLDLPPEEVTGGLLIDSIIAGNWDTFKIGLKHAILPSITLGIFYSSYFGRTTRNVLGNALNSNQVEFAKALGLSKIRVFLYALVDARTPIITYIAILFAGLFGASAIIETVFAWNGIGGWAIDKILMLDIPAIQGFILFAGLITLFTYTFLDILITFIDPRIRKKTL